MTGSDLGRRRITHGRDEPRWKGQGKNEKSRRRPGAAGGEGESESVCV